MYLGLHIFELLCHCRQLLFEVFIFLGKCLVLSRGWTS